MGHIFISYAREDRAFVGQLAREMTRRGIPVWDDSHLEHGEAWYRTTEERLDESAAVVLVMSRASRNSTWVTNELLRAQRKGIPVRPLLVGGDPWLAVESVNFIDLRDGGSPDESFFADLREVTSSTDRDDTSVSDDWFDATLFLPEARPDAHDAASGPSRPEQSPPSELDDSAGAGQPSPHRVQLSPASRHPRRHGVRRGTLTTALVLLLLGGGLTWGIIAGPFRGETPSPSPEPSEPAAPSQCCPWADDVPDSATVAIERNDIEVDGKLDDWVDHPAWSVTVPVDDDRFGLDPGDANTAQFAWNASSLFFAARIFDDDVIEKDPSLDGVLWTGDSVGFDLASVAYDDHGQSAHLRDGDLRIKLAPRCTLRRCVSGEDPGRATAGDRRAGGEWHDFELPPNAIVRDEQLSDGYTIEAAIPWESLTPTSWTPTAGEVLAMNVYAASTESYEDGGEPVLTTTSTYTRKIPRCWGRVLLWTNARGQPSRDVLDELEPGDVSMCPRR